MAKRGIPLPALIAGAAFTAPALAQEPTPVDPLTSLFERSTLTGDWHGARPALQDCGVTIDVNTTQFYQGVVSGGLDRSDPYGGRNDYFLNLDGEKLGLWKGFYVNLHGETRYGQMANFSTGALSPVNEYLLVPGYPGVVSGITALKFTQFLSENSLVVVGKINLLDEIVQPLTNAPGLTGFMNTSLIFNSILARTLPYSTFGASYIYMQDEHPVFVASVFDTNDTPTTSGFESFFDNGATIYGLLNLPTNFLGLPGHQGIEAAYSSGRYTNLSPSPYLDPVDELVFASPPTQGSWAVGYLFDQALWVSPDDPKRMWGLWGKFGIGDNNPNPVHWTASAGFAGASPIAGRNLDTFGIGYYYLGISSELKKTARPVTPLGNEQGVEIYYNARVTPWFQVTPDVQIIDPFQQQAHPAFVLGVRAKIDF